MARLLFLVSSVLLVCLAAGTNPRPYWQATGPMALDPIGMASPGQQEDRCGGGPRCLANVAECRGGQCACVAPYTWGSGDFACYRPRTLAAEVKNDPSVMTFAKEKYEFPFPGRYLITHIINDLKNSGGDVIGKCEFRIFGFNARKKGKIFNLGFDAAVRMTYNDGTKRGRTTRNYGVMKGKIPYVYSKTTRAYKPNGDWEDQNFGYWDSVNGVRLRLYGKRANTQIILKARQCGVKVSFVPYDVILMRKSPRVPGVSVAIKGGFNTEWGSKWGSMGLSPAWGRQGKLQHYRKAGMTDSESMVWRAFTRPIIQNQPWGAPDELAAVKAGFEACADWRERRMAIKSCFWMLEEERFMRCYDNQFNSKALLKLFGSCITMHCGKTTSCYDVKQMMRNKGCLYVDRIFKLFKFRSGDYCPETWRP